MEYKEIEKFKEEKAKRYNILIYDCLVNLKLNNNLNYFNLTFIERPL